MFYFPMDFGELNFDDLIHAGALTSAISEAHLRKIQLLGLRIFSIEAPPPDFQKLVVKGHLETPSAAVERQFEFGDFLFKRRFLVITNLTNTLIEFFFYEDFAPC